MKQIFLLALILISHLASAQILDPYMNWFDFENFFVVEEIEKNRVRRIRMEISNKKDDKFFYDQGEFIQYEFQKNGLLSLVTKRIPVSNGFDTSTVYYQYDQSKRLVFKDEQQGPFHFQYHYVYSKDGKEFRELKIRPLANSSDTLFDRTHLINSENGITEELIKNRVGKLFLKKLKSYNNSQMLMESRTIYLFNNNEIQTKYLIEDNRLVGKHYQKTFGEKKDFIWKYSYQKDQLQLVQIWKNGTLEEKIAFTYEERLPEAIIMRNFRDKYVRIYRCIYEYY